MNESESTVERSDGGSSEADPLLAKTLAHMKRVVPVFASGVPWSDSKDETDGFLASAAPSVVTEAFLEGSGIKPWHASVGVGGMLCRLGRLEGLIPLAVLNLRAARILSSSSNPLNLFRTW